MMRQAIFAVLAALLVIPSAEAGIALSTKTTVEGQSVTLTVTNKKKQPQANAEVNSLTFEDLTLDCGSNYLTDLRTRNPVTIRLRRCRVVGFDMGAGGSVMLAARSAAFYATDCRFEAGFSRINPGDGNLFRASSGLLVRIEGSVFKGHFHSVYDANAYATYVFSNCRFEDMSPRMKDALEKPRDGVRFHDCTFHYSEARQPKRSFSEINASWR